MNIDVCSYKNFNEALSDCLILGIFEDSSLFGSTKVIDDCSHKYITKLMKHKEFIGKFGEFLLLYEVPNIVSKKILLIGCGKLSSFDIYKYKTIFKISLNLLKKLPFETVIYFFTEFNFKNISTYWKVRFAIEIIHDNIYSFLKFKNKKVKKFSSLNDIKLNIILHNDFIQGVDAIKHGLIISKGIKIAKDLANMPPNICNPTYLFLQVKKLAKNYPNTIKTNCLNENDMKKLNMNAYLSVSQGSKNKPLMSVIEYYGDKHNQENNIVFIGKGVTFDSGGLSIKPALFMDEMKYDMSGAASVLGLMHIIVNLKLRLNVIGILAGCENMVSSKSFRPGDIITTMSGKTIEVLNTDAEGRLILCDTLTYVSRFNPKIVIDIATLTGACVVALGNYVTGLMSNNDILAEDLILSGNKTGDLVWRMPLFKEYYQDLYSNIADIANVGKNSLGGAITAACFLSKFAKEYTWAHLDIAGTAWHSGKNKNATGRPITLLTQFLLNMCQKKI